MPSLDFEMPRKILPIIFCVGKSSDRQSAEALKDALSDLYAY